MATLRQLASFLIRDFFIDISYRVGFAMTFLNVFFGTLIYFFLDRLIGGRDVPGLAQYGGDYFAFALIGVALSGYFSLGLNAFASNLREAQTTGTLEALLMTPASLPVVIVGSAVWSYTFTTFRISLYLLIGMLLGLNLQGGNFTAALFVLLLSIIAFASIGIISAAVIMVIKRGDPITAVLGHISTLLGGVLYPVEVLPEWLQPVARLLPITWSLRAMRGALLRGATWGELAPDLLVLALFAAILFPVSLWIFRLALRQAQREGSLGQF
jgi:ABC-2 type transport system permease protein